MEHTDRERFGALMVALAEYYGKTISPELISIYWEGLKHLDFSSVKDAVNRHLHNTDNGQFMPKIADIEKMLGGSTLDSALAAWSMVTKSVQSVGTYCTVSFDDKIIMRVIDDMGGWRMLGQKTTDEWPFVGNEFCARYRGYKARSEIPDAPKKLYGILDAENIKLGYPEQQPVSIGTPEQKRLDNKKSPG